MLPQLLALPVLQRLQPTRRRAGRRSIYVLGLLSAAACQEPQSADAISWDQLRQPVIGGTLDEESRYPGVVALLAESPQVSFCSGTLIAPNLVLTALHCVSTLNNMDFSCSLDGELIQHRAGAGELGAPVEPEDVSVYAGVVPDLENPVAKGEALFSTNSTQICRNDLALLVLDRDLDLPLTPLRLEERTVAGESVTVVGYGHSGDPVVARHFRSKVRIVDVGTDDRGGDGGFAPPRTFATGRATCPGDSGGPALAENAPGAPIAGLYSIVAGDCTTEGARNIFTQVAPFRELILEAFAYAGHEPLRVEPAMPPIEAGTGTGESDSSSDTMDQSSCVAGETGSRGCSRNEPTGDPSADEATSPERQRRLRSGCGIGVSGRSFPPSSLLLLALVLGVRHVRQRLAPGDSLGVKSSR